MLLDTYITGRMFFCGCPRGLGSVYYECLPFVFDYKLGRTKAPSSSCIVSLMSDQVSSLRGRDVSAAILSSHELTDKSVLATDKALQTPGMFSLLLASPEAVIGATKWREKLLEFPLRGLLLSPLMKCTASQNGMCQH